MEGCRMDIFPHNALSVLRTVVLVVACAYLAAVALVYVLQARLVYYPSRGLVQTPDAIGLSYEDVIFTSSDGVRLSGWLVPAKQPRAVLLLCHGNAGNISHRLDTIEIFHRLGLSTFIFDYRGYGESGGKPGERGTYLDALAAWEWLVNERNVPPDSIVIMGRSLGGPVAAWIAKEHTPKALIVESSFSSIRDLAADLYSWLPARYLSRFTYSTKDYLEEITCPVLVIHSPDDDVIPYRHGQLLFDSAREPKEFLRISGTHNDGFLLSGKRYVEGLDRFISRAGANNRK